MVEEGFSLEDAKADVGVPDVDGEEHGAGTVHQARREAGGRLWKRPGGERKDREKRQECGGWREKGGGDGSDAVRGDGERAQGKERAGEGWPRGGRWGWKEDGHVEQSVTAWCSAWCSGPCEVHVNTETGDPRTSPGQTL